MKKVITTMLVAAMVLSMAMPTSAATITRKKSTGTTASTTKVSGDYSLKMVDKTLQFIRGGKVVSSIETKDGKITLRKSSAGGVSVVFTDANGKRRNITLGKQNSVALSGTFVQVSVDKALGSSFEVEMEKGSKVTNFYAKGAAKVTLNGSVTTLNVTSSNANVAANGTVSRAYAVNKKAISGMSSGKITQTSTGTSASGSVNTSTGSSSSSNTTVNNGSGSGNGSSSSGSNGIIINGGGSNGGTVVTTTAAKEAAKITTAKIGTASVKVGATNAEVKAAVEAKAKILVTSGYTVTFNQTNAADTSKAGATSVTGTFTVSKGSDKATTKAMTISVNVTAVTVPAVIEKVVAENGLVNIVLENNPSVTPTDANFNPVIKAYINGGAAADLAGLKFESYEEASKTVVYSFTKIAATDEDQSVVVGAKLGSANEVKADAFKIPAIVKAEIAAVKATNGTIDIELVENPSTDVTAESFAPVIKAYIDGAEGIDLKDVSFGKYDSTTKTVSYTFTPIEATDAEQSVVVGAKLGSADEVKAEAFKVPAKGATVEAEIVSVTAENGKISVVLKENPTTEPSAENFTPVIKAYINNAETGVDLTGLTFGEYNSTTKTVSYTFTNIPATDADQTVVIGVKLADAAEVKSNEFKIDAAATGEKAGDVSVTVALGDATKTTFTEGDADAYIQATATVDTTTGVEGTLSYQWYASTSNSFADADRINGATDAKYLMKQIDQAEDAGSYYFCEVVNRVGEVGGTDTTETKKASAATKYITVNYPDGAAEKPVISATNITSDYKKTYTQDVTTNVDDLSVTVDKPARATAVVTYQWYKVSSDGTEVALEDAKGTVDFGAGADKAVTYTPKVTSAEAGSNQYYCLITLTDEDATTTNPAYKKNQVKSNIATIVVNSNLTFVTSVDGVSGTTDSTKITIKFSDNKAYAGLAECFMVEDETIPEGESSAISVKSVKEVQGGKSYEIALDGTIPKDNHKVKVSIDTTKLPEGISFRYNSGIVTLFKGVTTTTVSVTGIEALDGTAETKDTKKIKVVFDAPAETSLGGELAASDFVFGNPKTFNVTDVDANENKTEYTLTGTPVTTDKTKGTEKITLTLVTGTAGTVKIPTDGKQKVTINRDITGPTMLSAGLNELARSNRNMISIVLSDKADLKDTTGTGTGTLAAANFVVKANGNTLSQVGIPDYDKDSATVTITLTEDFPSGATGTVEYVAAGGSGVNFVDDSVNKNVMESGSTITFGTGTVEGAATVTSVTSVNNASSDTVTVSFDLKVKAKGTPSDLASQFTVTQGATSKAIASAAIVGGDVVITLTDDLDVGKPVTVKYTPSTANAATDILVTEMEPTKEVAAFEETSAENVAPQKVANISLGGLTVVEATDTASAPTGISGTAEFDVTADWTVDGASGIVAKGDKVTYTAKLTAKSGYSFTGTVISGTVSGGDADMLTVTISPDGTTADLKFEYTVAAKKITSLGTSTPSITLNKQANQDVDDAISTAQTALNSTTGVDWGSVTAADQDGGSLSGATADLTSVTKVVFSVKATPASGDYVFADGLTATGWTVGSIDPTDGSVIITLEVIPT